MKKKLKKKTIILILIILLFLSTFFGGIIIIYREVHGVESKLKIKLNGKSKEELEVGNTYKDKGAKAYYEKKNLSKNIKTKDNINEKELGSYKVTYIVKYKKISRSITREVSVVDKTKPVIELSGGDVEITVGSEYNEVGYKATDNYDGDLTEKVEVNSNVDINTVGEYIIKYTVKDSSKNEVSVERKVKIVEKRVSARSASSKGKVAVLNYHFFYDPDIGESCNLSICEKVSDFKAQLNYLKENGYKALTMKEFRDWMYGSIEIPDNSVLITIDDGAMGTGSHNGNKLIPILEEYKMHATLFLITGWWDINNYRSEYLDIESHTNDMHTEGVCTGVTRGAQMLCNDNNTVLNDLKTSISITKSTLAFCFPFYAYNDNAIQLVKEAGFELAFIGGNRKASRNDDKYHIPRYPIQKSTSLEQFINFVS